LIKVTLAPTFTARRDRTIIVLLRDTGMRRSEVAAIKVSDLDLETGCVVVPRSKSRRMRVVPLSESAVRVLRHYMRSRETHRAASSEFLWLGRRGPMGSDAIRLMLERRSKQAGVCVSAHQFRRRFAYVWTKNGGSQTSLMRCAGWSTSTMISRYTRGIADALTIAEYRRIVG
jgi:integrase